MLYTLIYLYYLFFSFFEKKKRDSRVVVIVPRLMVHLGKLMGTTSLNWSSKTPNSYTPQTILVSRIYQKLLEDLELIHTPDSIGFWDLPEIAITVLARTQTQDVIKPHRSPTSCTTLAGSLSILFIIGFLSLN